MTQDGVPYLSAVRRKHELAGYQKRADDHDSVHDPDKQRLRGHACVRILHGGHASLLHGAREPQDAPCYRYGAAIFRVCASFIGRRLLPCATTSQLSQCAESQRSHNLTHDIAAHAERRIDLHIAESNTTSRFTPAQYHIAGWLACAAAAYLHQAWCLQGDG